MKLQQNKYIILFYYIETLFVLSSFAHVSCNWKQYSSHSASFVVQDKEYNN